MAEIAEQVWRLQREWSERANRLKATYNRWQVIVLSLAIAGAVLGTLSAQLAGSRLGGLAPPLAGAGAAALALVAIVGQWATTPDRLRGWIRARSVSEELKSQVYVLLAGCGEAAAEMSREKLTWNRAMELVEAAADLAGDEAVGDQRPLPAVHDVDSYIATRLDCHQPMGQIQYYRHAAAQSGRTVRRSRNLRFAMACCGAIVGAVGALGDLSLLTAWIGVATTGLTAFAAHVAAGRHEFLAISYSATATRLRRLVGSWAIDPGDPCRFIEECETAISSQNEGWMAEFTKKAE